MMTGKFIPRRIILNEAGSVGSDIFLFLFGVASCELPISRGKTRLESG